MNSILQMRKSLFEKEKKEEVEKIINKAQDKTASTDKNAESGDSQSSEKIDDKKMSTKETTTEESKDSKEPEEPTEPKIGRIQKIKEKVSTTTNTINEKAPFVYKTGVFFKNLWQETFPNDDRNVKSRIHKRREIAKVQANYTPEEIEEMQENIPEWKRTAVTMVDDQQVEEKEAGAFKKLYKKIGSKVSDTKIAKQIMQSEEYKNMKQKYREVKQETSEFKEDFKDEVETTQNPVVGGARSVTDYVFRETDLSKAIGKMKQYDPEFDVLDLHYEIEEIFIDLFDNYLEGDLEYLQKFWGDAALAVIKTEFQRRVKEGWEHKYKELLFCNDANLVLGAVPEDNLPRFTFTISAQDINWKVSKKDPNEIVEGGDNDIEKGVYKITVRKHDEPDMALTGHYWEVVEFEKHEAVKQLV